MKKAFGILLATAITVSIVACGGGSSDTDVAGDRALAVVQAWADHNPQEACGLMSSESLSLFESSGPLSCEKAIFYGLDEIRLPEVTDASLSGDKGTVEVEVSGGDVVNVDVVRERGDWKVSDFMKAS